MYENHEILKKYDLKVTPQRLAIVELMQLYGHLSIEELYLYIKKRFHSISLATLYKNINLMVGVDLVKEVKIPNEKSRYELTKDPHSHLLCQKCNKIQDIFLDLKTIVQDCELKTNYMINESVLVLSGVCPNCQ